jgi:hypothetical protein
MIKKISVFILFVFLILCPLLVCYNPHREIATNWIKLAAGENTPLVSKEAQFGAVLFNGDTLQTELTCNNCPIEITTTDKPDGIAFKFKAKWFLKKHQTDTLELICNYKSLSWNHLKKPKRTFIISTECEIVSQLVYNKVIENLNSQTKLHNIADTLHKSKININEIFEKLTTGDLKEWIAIQKSQSQNVVDSFNLYCFQYFNALQYFAEGKQSGFKSGRYNLQDSSLHNKNIVNYIHTIADILKNVAAKSNNLKGNLELYVTGYTDSIQVGAIPIDLNKEDIHDKILYDKNCIENTKRVGVFIPFEANVNSPTISNISDNCELSAVRAYYTTKMLKKYLGAKIGNTNITYHYRAGGVSNGKNLADNRKISISIQLNTVSSNQSK